MRVLIVQDDPDHAELVRRGLEDERPGVEIALARDAEAALAHLEAAGVDTPGGGRPHLILVDLRLPRMSGLDLLRAVKARPDMSEVPCVVLTTSAAESDRARAHELRVADYLVKPGDRACFARLVAEVDRHWLRLGSVCGVTAPSTGRRRPAASRRGP